MIIRYSARLYDDTSRVAAALEYTARIHHPRILYIVSSVHGVISFC